jgi:hypothetical protein
MLVASVGHDGAIIRHCHGNLCIVHCTAARHHGRRGKPLQGQCQDNQPKQEAGQQAVHGKQDGLKIVCGRNC